MEELVFMYQKPNNMVICERLPYEWKNDPDLEKSLEGFALKGNKNFIIIDPNTNERLKIPEHIENIWKKQKTPVKE